MLSTQTNSTGTHKEHHSLQFQVEVLQRLRATKSYWISMGVGRSAPLGALTKPVMDFLSSLLPRGFSWILTQVVEIVPPTTKASDVSGETWHMKVPEHGCIGTAFHTVTPAQVSSRRGCLCFEFPHWWYPPGIHRSKLSWACTIGLRYVS